MTRRGYESHAESAEAADPFAALAGEIGTGRFHHRGGAVLVCTAGNNGEPLR